MEQLGTAVHRVLADLRDRMDGKTGAGVEARSGVGAGEEPRGGKEAGGAPGPALPAGHPHQRTARRPTARQHAAG